MQLQGTGWDLFWVMGDTHGLKYSVFSDISAKTFKILHIC